MAAFGISKLQPAVNAAAGAYAVAATDMPFDKLAKFSAFGPESLRGSSMDKTDQAWAMAKSYDAWDRSNIDGLKTWLQAAHQLLFGFTVQGFAPTGPKPSEAYIRIETQRREPASSLHIEYEATYAHSGDLHNKDMQKTLSGRIWIVPPLTSERTTMSAPGGHYVMEDAVDIQDNRIDIYLVQVNPLLGPPGRDGKRRELVLYNLTCKVRLDIFSDGDPTQQGADSSLVVPTMADGMMWVKAVTRGGQAKAEYKSFVEDDLGL